MQLRLLAPSNSFATALQRRSEAYANATGLRVELVTGGVCVHTRADTLPFLTAAFSLADARATGPSRTVQHARTSARCTAEHLEPLGAAMKVCAQTCTHEPRPVTHPSTKGHRPAGCMVYVMLGWEDAK